MCLSGTNKELTHLQTKLWRKCALTNEPQWPGCGTHNSNPSLKVTAVLATSSSSLRLQDAINKEKSQSPLRSEDADRKEADWHGELRLDLTTALSARTPGWSQLVPEWLLGRKNVWQSTMLRQSFRQVGLQRGVIEAHARDILLEEEYAHCWSQKGRKCERRHTSHPQASILHMVDWPEATVCQKGQKWWWCEYY